jgi:ribosomal protein S18 acetylase RimI-like enzyme
MSQPEIQLRPASPADRDFVTRVYFETQRWLIEKLFGWRGEDIERAKFGEFYDEHRTQVVEVNGDAAGWLTVFRDDRRIEIDSIYLLTERQGAGIGTYVLQQLIAEADATQKLLTLSTAKINPARRLYERLGFRVVRESEFKVYMEREPRHLTRGATCASIPQRDT